MQKYVMIALMKIYRSNPSDKFVTKIICIILWRNMCLVFIKGYVIPNTISLFRAIVGYIKNF